MEFTEIHHVAIIGSDYPASKEFYTKVLGFPVIAETYREERNSYKLDLQAPSGVQIELFSFPNPPARVTGPEATGLRHLAFGVVNVGMAIEELKAKGVRVEEPPRIDPVTGKVFTFFFDPDDLPLELYESEKK